MKKLINRVLKLVGLNLVRAKRRKTTKWQAIPLGPTGLPPYTREELEKCPLDAKCNQPHPFNVPLSDYMGQSEWENTPPVAVPVPNPGKTHFCGDGCEPPHPEFETPRVPQPSSDNDVKGTSS